MHLLDDRLQAVFSQVKKGTVAADIGTDHGYIPAALLEADICPFVYACDLREGPLLAAKRTLSAYDPGRWSALLSDGLADLPEEVETVILAGMGQDVLLGILDRRKSFWTQNRTFIIQPMTGQELFRQGMQARGFRAQKEVAAYCGGKAYSVMVYTFEGKVPPLTAGEAAFGLHLYQKPDKAALAYLRNRKNWLLRMKKGCEAAACMGVEERKKQAFAAAALSEFKQADLDVSEPEVSI